MKDINIATTIMERRKEKGITQDQLAEYIGVSKSSVSKWETGQSYPDITFLPMLATFFNISIDELMNYSPQMTISDINTLYHHLAKAFSHRPFDDVLLECQQVIKKYYSCFPLLLQMATLLLNHQMLASNENVQKDILQQIIDLCQRIKSESDDIWLAKQANSIEAVCYMFLQEPDTILDLLSGALKPDQSDAIILANAYQMAGQPPKAKEVIQISIYQHLMNMLGAFPSFLLLYADDNKKFDEILKRGIIILDGFKIESLNPNIALQIYHAAAHGYMTQNEHKKALNMLSIYADVCTKLFPVTHHGDAFFDAIDDWFLTFDLGVVVPRDEKVVKESILTDITTNPAFAPLAKDLTYMNIVNTLKKKLGGI
ncbi:helix-turn-helix transcriptional regulator [Vallitalea pronyensis]|uniref:Helix-turn-helix transcriptional regulator n=1 Tax=Vallitalea pronyensis TaxID=1348613 RepID=A0A8J8MNT5_9FIRM|nr:helix-turn-helix transcriptional regulator [Vallitalea pronyensis]QUI24817.1 helix-turn-helix transcriptional regulator [Vallitalea pronyensis]